MTRNGIVGIASACVLAVALGQPAWLGAQAGAAPKAQTAAAEKKAAPSSASLGSVHIPRKVVADGQALPAGTYSLLEPATANELRERKLAALQAGAPRWIASANIGCLSHLQGATDTPVRHWIELIDAAQSVESAA